MIRDALPLILLFVSVTLALQLPETAHAQAATCPAGAACLAIVPASQTAASAGSTLKLNVSFVNFPTFAGWDISVKTNNAVLSPTSITLVETFGGTASTFSNCVNGAGSGCGANDGAGVAHSAAASLGASDAGNGVLFTIAYNAIANGVTSVTYVASTVSAPDGSSVVDCTATPNQCLTGSVTVGTPAFDYSLSNNGPVAIQAGSSGTATVTATLTAGTAKSTTLSCATPLPTGITCGSFTVNPVTPTSAGAASDVTINVASSVVAGSYTVQVTGSPPGATASASSTSISVTVTPPPPPAFDYALSNNGPVTIQAGSSGTVTITATLTAGTAQPVTLSCSSLPAGITCGSFTMSPVTPSSTGATSDLTINVASSVAAGPYTFDVAGSPAGATASGATTTVSITVTAPPPPAFDYSLTNSGPVTIQAGSSGAVTISATLTAGSAVPVTLSCVSSTLPAGVTCGSFTVNPVTPSSAGVTSDLTINIGSSVAAGSISLDVTGTPAGATASAATTTVSITVTSPPPPAFDYSLSNNGPVTVQAGSSGTVTVTATLTAGTAVPVTLSCVSLTPPSVITCGSFTVNPVTPSSAGATSDLTINVASSVAAGSYSLDITGTPLGATTTATTVSVMVTTPPPPTFDYSLSNNGPVTIQAGSSGTVTITATLTSGTAAPVTLSCAAILPSGITCGSFTVNPVTPSSTGATSDLTINVDTTVAAGSYSVDVTASPLGATTTATTITVTVTAPPPPTFDYSLSNNGPVTIQAGSSGTVTITATLTAGSPQSVTLSCVSSALPTGVTCGSFTVNPVSPSSTGATSDLTVNVASSVVMGTYHFDVIGTPAGATASGATTTVSLVVTLPPPSTFDYSLSNNGPATIQTGSSGTVTVTATLTAGTAQSITLSCVDSTLPAGITCGSFTLNPVTPTGSSDLTIDVASSVAAGGYSLDVTGNPLGATTTPTTIRITVTVATGQADFVLSASSTSLTTMGESSLCEGSSKLCDDEASTRVTVTSVNGFTGAVRLSISVSPSDDTLTAYCSPRAVFLMADGARGTLCQVEPEINPSSPITYTVTITAKSGTVSHSLTITVTVTPNPFVHDSDNASLSSALSATILTTTESSSNGQGASTSHRHFPRSD